MKTICICCPIGCELNIEEKDGKVVVTGNRCPRGKAYGETEFTCPKRVLTATIKNSYGVYSVKTTAAIKKEKLFEAVALLNNLNDADYKEGEIIVYNILGENADIVVTGKNNL